MARFACRHTPRFCVYEPRARTASRSLLDGPRANVVVFFTPDRSLVRRDRVGLRRIIFWCTCVFVLVHSASVTVRANPLVWQC